MAKHKIKSYPVDNGDTTLITLTDNTTILIDCKIRISAEDPDDTAKFDVKKDLLESILKRDDNPFLDAFILTHPDKDHCHGFAKHFYCGEPGNYKKENRDNEEIIVDEMWVTAMLFDGPACEDAKALKKEAERRRKLWDNNSSDKDKPGNRIHMIGYNGDEKYENVPASVPGETVNKINGKVKDNFEFFVHSPFKKNLITASAEDDKNFSSIVMQARFKINSSDKALAARFLFGGDADHNIWEQILTKSKKHNRTEKLDWDIFLSSHHCSWTFFNNVPYTKPEENKTPKESSLSILDYKVGNGKIIASCKEIKDDEDNPPHHKTKEEYVKKVAKNDFIELATNPSLEEPKPVIFEISDAGIKRTDEGAKLGSLRNATQGINAGIFATSAFGKVAPKTENTISHKAHRFHA